MRGRLKVIFVIVVGYSLMLVVQYGVLAQAKRDQESPRAMIERLHQEIEDAQAKIAESPSSPEVAKLKQKIQWNKRKIEEILPGVTGQTESKKIKKVPKSGLERYMIIAENNLFTPLGSGVEVKRQEFALTGILGKAALIQTVGGAASYYVTQGESFGNSAKLTRVGKDSVTIIHEGNKTELRLGEDISTSGSQRKGGRESGQPGKPIRKDDRKKMEDVRREEEMRMREEEERRRREQEEREHIEGKIHDLHREREEIKRRIVEMEERGHVDHDAYRRVEEIDRIIGELESSLR